MQLWFHHGRSLLIRAQSLLLDSCCGNRPCSRSTHRTRMVNEECNPKSRLFYLECLSCSEGHKKTNRRFSQSKSNPLSGSTLSSSNPVNHHVHKSESDCPHQLSSKNPHKLANLLLHMIPPTGTHCCPHWKTFSRKSCPFSCTCMTCHPNRRHRCNGYLL